MQIFSVINHEVTSSHFFESIRSNVQKQKLQKQDISSNAVINENNESMKTILKFSVLSFLKEKKHKVSVTTF